MQGHTGKTSKDTQEKQAGTHRKNKQGHTGKTGRDTQEKQAGDTQEKEAGTHRKNKQGHTGKTSRDTQEKQAGTHRKNKQGHTGKTSRDAQEKTFVDFYKMDTNAKHSNINITSVCVSIKPSKSCKGNKIDTIENPTRRKKKSYSFYIIDEEDSAKVCKDFYLSTLAVSQKMVYSAHEKKDPVTGAIKADGRGKHSKHHHVSDIDRQNVIDHINSFQVVDSHYRRAKTNNTWNLG